MQNSLKFTLYLLQNSNCGFHCHNGDNKVSREFKNENLNFLWILMQIISIINTDSYFFFMYLFRRNKETGQPEVNPDQVFQTAKIR